MSPDFLSDYDQHSPVDVSGGGSDIRRLSTGLAQHFTGLWSGRSSADHERISQETMYYNDFAGWVREQLDAGPFNDDTDAARKLGVPPSTVTRWLGIRYPTRATTRQVATLFDVPIHEVLVAGGYMTPDEAASVTVGPGHVGTEFSPATGTPVFAGVAGEISARRAATGEGSDFAERFISWTTGSASLDCAASKSGVESSIGSRQVSSHLNPPPILSGV